MPRKRRGLWDWLRIGDVLAYSLVTCTVAASAAFPFYVHYNRDKFGPPLMQFYGADEQAKVPEVAEASYERQRTAFLKPRLELDRITTGSIKPGTQRPRDRVVPPQPFPDDAAKVQTDLEILFVSSGHLLAVDRGRMLSLKTGSLLSDGSRITAITKTRTGWEVRTSAGTVTNWTGKQG